MSKLSLRKKILLSMSFVALALIAVGAGLLFTPVSAYSEYVMTIDCSGYGEPNVTIEAEVNLSGQHYYWPTYIYPGYTDGFNLRMGYTYKGLYTKPNGTGDCWYDATGVPVPAHQIEATGNVVLYPHWELLSGTITVYFGYGEEQTISSEYGFWPSWINVNDYKKGGYEFKGIYEEENGGGTCWYDEYGNGPLKEATGEVTLYAYYEMYESTITVYLQDGTGNAKTISSSGGYWPNPIDYSYYEITRTGYKLKGLYTETNGKGDCWYDKYGNGPFYVEATEDATLYAYWSDNWIDYAETPTGTGTSSDPYIIDTAEHLAWIAQQVNSGTTFSDKYFQQTKSIDLSKNKEGISFGTRYWTPIGNETYAFAGTYIGEKTFHNHCEKTYNAYYNSGSGTLRRAFCDCNTFGAVMKSGIGSSSVAYSHICNHSENNKYNNSHTARFQTFASNFETFLSAIEKNGKLSVIGYDGKYDPLFASAQTLFDSSLVSGTKKSAIGYEYNNSGVIGISEDYTATYTHNATVNALTVNTLQKSLAKLFGFSDFDTFKQYVTKIASIYKANPAGASNSSAKSRLKYDGAIFVEGDFVLPYAFKSNTTDVATTLVALIVLNDGTVAAWVSDVVNMAIATATETNRTITTLGRCQLFESTTSTTYSIENMTTIRCDYAGLFGKSSGRIESLIINKCNVDGTRYAGAFAGYSTGTIVYAKLGSDTNTVDARSDVSGVSTYAGGIAGYATSNVNQTAYNDLNTTVEARSTSGGGSAYAGGCVGYSTGSVTANSYAKSVTAQAGSSGNAYAGGCVGYSFNSPSGLSARWCGAEVKAKGSGNNYAGGVCGWIENTRSNILKLYSTGTQKVSAESYYCYVGGIAGYSKFGLNSQYSNSQYFDIASNSIELSAKSTNRSVYVGGLIGKASQDVALGDDVNIESLTINADGYSVFVGGLLGWTDNQFIDNCRDITISTCTITATNSGAYNHLYAGGLIGCVDDMRLGGICKIPNLTITGESAGDFYAGGIVGGASTVFIITGCDVNVSIKSNSKLKFGGIVSFVSYGEIDVCNVNATIESSEVVYFGGIVGSLAGVNSSKVSRCAIACEIKLLGGSTSAYIGGIIGYIDNLHIADISEIYVSKMNIESVVTNFILGGAVGYNAGNITTIDKVILTYSAPSGTKGEYIGAFIGENAIGATVKVTNSYYEGTLCDGEKVDISVGKKQGTAQFEYCLIRTTRNIMTSLIVENCKCVILESEAGNYYYTSDGDWSNWGIVNGKPLPKALFHIANVGESCSETVLKDAVANGGLGYTKLTV